MNGHIIPGAYIAVDTWKRGTYMKYVHFLSHCHQDHISGLSASWKAPIYTSEFNGWFLETKIKLNGSLLKGLSVGESHIITEPGCGESFTVTLIDANHCPGAVMFLFQGSFGRILYTGDFRYDPIMLQNPELSRVIKSELIDTLYVDNTYASTSCEIPSKDKAAKEIFRLISEHPNHQILIGVRNLGKEELLRDIALIFNENIYVSEERMKILKKLKYEDVFTTNPTNSRIHCISSFLVSVNYMIRKRKEDPDVIAILPSALFRCGIDSSCTPFKNSQEHGIYVVPYSDHSCYSELYEFISLVKPAKLVPIVRRKKVKSNDPMNYWDKLVSICNIPIQLTALCREKKTENQPLLPEVHKEKEECSTFSSSDKMINSSSEKRENLKIKLPNGTAVKVKVHPYVKNTLVDVRVRLLNVLNEYPYNISNYDNFFQMAFSAAKHSVNNSSMIANENNISTEQSSYLELNKEIMMYIKGTIKQEAADDCNSIFSACTLIAQPVPAKVDDALVDRIKEEVDWSSDIKISGESIIQLFSDEINISTVSYESDVDHCSRNKRKRSIDVESLASYRKKKQKTKISGDSDNINIDNSLLAECSIPVDNKVVNEQSKTSNTSVVVFPEFQTSDILNASMTHLKVVQSKTSNTSVKPFVEFPENKINNIVHESAVTFNTCQTVCDQVSSVTYQESECDEYFSLDEIEVEDVSKKTTTTLSEVKKHNSPGDIDLTEEEDKEETEVFSNNVSGLVIATGPNLEIQNLSDRMQCENHKQFSTLNNNCCQSTTSNKGDLLSEDNINEPNINCIEQRIENETQESINRKNDSCDLLSEDNINEPNINCIEGGKKNKTQEIINRKNDADKQHELIRYSDVLHEEVGHLQDGKCVSNGTAKCGKNPEYITKNVAVPQNVMPLQNDDQTSSRKDYSDDIDIYAFSSFLIYCHYKSVKLGYGPTEGYLERIRQRLRTIRSAIHHISSESSSSTGASNIQLNQQHPSLHGSEISVAEKNQTLQKSDSVDMLTNISRHKLCENRISALCDSNSHANLTLAVESESSSLAVTDTPSENNKLYNDETSNELISPRNDKFGEEGVKNSRVQERPNSQELRSLTRDVHCGKRKRNYEMFSSIETLHRFNLNPESNVMFVCKLRDLVEKSKCCMIMNPSTGTIREQNSKCQIITNMSQPVLSNTHSCSNISEKCSSSSSNTNTSLSTNNMNTNLINRINTVSHIGSAIEIKQNQQIAGQASSFSSGNSKSKAKLENSCMKSQRR